MMFPSTLAEAFENSSHGAGAGAGQNGKSVAISPEHRVDLNAPPSPHVTLDAEEEETDKNQIENTPPSTSKKCQINQDDEEEEFSHKAKRIMTLDEAIQFEKNDRDLSLEDERKLRRTVSNRLSAQRSRLKRAQYIDELLKKIKDLQDYVESLTSQLESCIEGQKMLKMQKAILEQRLKNCIDKSALCDREIEEKQAEIRRLKYLYEALQKEGMMLSSAAPSAASSTSSLPIYPPESESNYQRVLSFNSASFFQIEQRAAVVEVVSSDQGGIEQYLNLDAMNVSSFNATDAM
nr:basic leucine zipper 61-like [Coffea arabica]